MPGGPRHVRLAYSPCPNDTALFGPIACGCLSLPGITLETHLHDIETLNRYAQAGHYDISKVSVFGYLKSRKHYRLLDTGAALGFGCGPLLVTALHKCPEIQKCRILFPGELTTAYLLFRLLFPESPVHKHHFAPYNRIDGLVADGAFECGVIVHETRFTYPQQDLKLLLDLGQVWEKLTGLPTPLGCCVIRRDLDASLDARFEQLICQGLDQREQHAGKVSAYIRRHAIELDPTVIEQHIHLYLNAYSRELGEPGRRAIRELAQRAESAGLLDGTEDAFL